MYPDAGGGGGRFCAADAVPGAAPTGYGAGWEMGAVTCTGGPVGENGGTLDPDCRDCRRSGEMSAGLEGSCVSAGLGGRVD